MEIRFRLTRLRATLLGCFVAVVAAGIGYAAIPGSGNASNACMLNATGTIRLVDPSAPATSLVSRPCNPKLETAISWNQQGPQGLPGNRARRARREIRALPVSKVRRESRGRRASRAV